MCFLFVCLSRSVCLIDCSFLSLSSLLFGSILIMTLIFIDIRTSNLIFNRCSMTLLFSSHSNTLDIKNIQMSSSFHCRVSFVHSIFCSVLAFLFPKNVSGPFLSEKKKQKYSNRSTLKRRRGKQSLSNNSVELLDVPIQAAMLFLLPLFGRLSRRSETTNGMPALDKNWASESVAEPNVRLYRMSESNRPVSRRDPFERPGMFIWGMGSVCSNRIGLFAQNQEEQWFEF